MFGGWEAREGRGGRGSTGPAVGGCQVLHAADFQQLSFSDRSGICLCLITEMCQRVWGGATVAAGVASACAFCGSNG